MIVCAFKVGNFRHTHERQAFRKLCERLEGIPEEQDIYLIANATLPDVEFRNPGSQKTRKFRGVSPDIIVIKHDALAVVEMKSYPGVIYFPEDKAKIWDPWAFEVDGEAKLINEGMSQSPLGQVNTNCQAFRAFLDTYEEQFADDDSKGSMWHKTRKIILFTSPGTEFACPSPKHWRATDVALLECSEDSNRDVAKILADLTTSERNYRVDDRSQIDLTETTILKITELLEAKPFEFHETAVSTDAALVDGETEDEVQEVIFPEYGVAPIHNLGHRLKVDAAEDLKPVIGLPNNIQGQELPVRVIHYYIRCLEEEAKLSSSLNMQKPQDFYVVQDMQEPLFLGDQSLKIDESRTPNRFLTPDTRLTYGFLFVIVGREWNGKTYYNGEPLFMRDVRIERLEGSYCCESAVKDELTVNRKALRYFDAFSNLSQEEVEEFLKEVDELDSVQEKITHVLEMAGLDAPDTYSALGQFDPGTVAKGLLQTALIYQSSGGFYARTIKELQRIAAHWDSNNNNSDLAWKFIDGISSDNICRTWNPAMLTIVDSNYEQSQAVGLALAENNQLQIISGPPGTGKSQVIQNIIANAAHVGGTVLFASRNNKAVDVVVERMNGKALDHPLVFRTGSNQQNDLFAQALKKVDPIGPEKVQQMTQGKVLAKSELTRLGTSLQQLHKANLDYEQAIVEMEDIHEKFEQIQEEHEGLFYLTNWYDKTNSDFGRGIWSQLKADYAQGMSQSQSLLSRFRSRSKVNSIGSILWKEQFQDEIKTQFVQKLKNNLPPEILKFVGSENIVSVCDGIFEIIGQLEKLSEQFGKYVSIVANYDEEKDLAEWTKLERNRIDRSKFLMELEWANRHTAKGVENAIKMLTDWKTPVKFAQILRLFPCCATTSLSASNKIPLTKGMFNIVVIDEASQADVASILPILFRGQRAVIIGDEMQLRPIVTLDAELDYEVARACGLSDDEYNRYSYLKSSLLDLANDRFVKAGGVRVLLRDHFRCHPNIISYSNRCFYDNMLRVKTDAKETAGVYLYNIQGVSKRRWYNDAEIQKVCKLVQDAIKRGFQHQEIGVVTPFRMQANHIIEKLRKYGLFSGENGTVTVATAHGFQGDEKEVMIFSLVIGDGMPPRSINWIHDITTDSKNLLNVALTRAKQELHIVGDKNRCQEAGGLLKELMCYCERVANA